MKALTVLVILLLTGATACIAQERSRLGAGFDVGSGFKNNSWAPSILYHEEIGLRRLPWLQLALGFRAWGYYGGKTDLISQNETDFREKLEYRNLSSNGLSFVTGINIQVWKIDLGVNTDLIGLALGSKRNAYYPKSTQTPGEGAAYYNKWVSTGPTVFNALPLVFGKSSGQSELYARIWVTRNLGLKLGYLYGRQAYSTNKVDGKLVFLDHGQRHFSATYGMPYAALAFSLNGAL